MSGENLNEFVQITCVPHEFIGIYEINRLGHIKTGKTIIHLNPDIQKKNKRHYASYLLIVRKSIPTSNPSQ